MDLSEKSDSLYRHPWELSRTGILLKKLKKLGIHGKVLDIGCGDAYFDQRMIKEFPQITELWGVDIYADKDIHRGKEHYVSSYEMIGGGDFDYVLLMDVLEHMEDDIAFLQELHRYLTDRTVLFVTVPAFQRLFSLHDLQLHHFRRYNYKSLSRTMHASGYFISHYTYFYLSLILIRILGKNRTQNLGMWKRPENDFLTKLLKGCLDLDYFTLQLLSTFGIHIGGLSMLAVCRQSNCGKYGRKAGTGR